MNEAKKTCTTRWWNSVVSVVPGKDGMLEICVGWTLRSLSRRSSDSRWYLENSGSYLYSSATGELEAHISFYEKVHKRKDKALVVFWHLRSNQEACDSDFCRCYFEFCFFVSFLVMFLWNEWTVCKHFWELFKFVKEV